MHTLIYCAALSAAKCNGARIRTNVDEVKDFTNYRTLKWKKPVTKKIEDIRMKLGRLTEFAKGSPSKTTAKQSIENNKEL